MTTKSLGNLERNFRFFPSKGLSTNNKILVENNEIVREEKKLENIMNNYFTNTITRINLKPTSKLILKQIWTV